MYKKKKHSSLLDAETQMLSVDRVEERLKRLRPILL